MAIKFKTLMKRQVRMMPPNTIRFLEGGKVIISRDLRQKMKAHLFLEVMVDEDYNKLAFKPSDDSIRGYKISKQGLLQCASLGKAGIKGEFKARFTEGKMIIDNIDAKEMEALDFWED